MLIDAKELNYRTLNNKIRECDSCTVIGCLGQRFIAAGMKNKKITLHGISGNALGAYLTGAEITVLGNAQDAVGDTMNDGLITVNGNVGDAPGYAMRGGKIFVKGNAGYRVGIHMKEYKEKKPVIVIGGRCGSFLGEYQAGGILAVLGIEKSDKPLVGNFPCTGMHGGKLYLRGNIGDIDFPSNVSVKSADEEDMNEIIPFLKEFCVSFDYKTEELLSEPFTVITPDTKNPYKQMYVAN